ncbi:MAG: Mpo1-like protein [Polyangiaceae bacterium]
MHASTDAQDPYASATFEDFWPHYVRMHSRPETQKLHAVATGASMLFWLTALKKRSLTLAVLAPLADYAIAQVSHRVFEANATTPYKNPLWHTRAELRMFRLVLTSKMAAEVARHAA